MTSPINDEEIERLLHYLRTAQEKHAEAAGAYSRLDHMRPAIKARLMKKAAENGAQSAAKAEMEALADPEYEEFVEGLAAAREQELLSKYQLDRVERKIDLQRSFWSTVRAELRSR